MASDLALRRRGLVSRCKPRCRTSGCRDDRQQVGQSAGGMAELGLAEFGRVEL